MAADNAARRIAEATIGGDFIVIHIEIAKAVGGIQECIFLEYIYRWQLRSQDGWAYRTEDEIHEQTTLTARQQRLCREKLKGLGILEEERKGLPARLYYRINYEAVIGLIPETSSYQTEPRVVTKGDNTTSQNVTAYIGVTGEEQEKDTNVLHAVRRKRQVPADWWPDQDGEMFAVQRGILLTIHFPREVEKFRDHHRAKGNTFVDIGLAWKNWCRNWHPPRANGNGQAERPYDWRVGFESGNEYTDPAYVGYQEEDE